MTTRATHRVQKYLGFKEIEDESIDAMLLCDILHSMESEKRKRVYNNGHRILRRGAILSVYPKHCKSDEPLWNLSNVE